jgi:hypothetical protein
MSVNSKYDTSKASKNWNNFGVGMEGLGAGVTAFAAVQQYKAQDEANEIAQQSLNLKGQFGIAEVASQLNMNANKNRFMGGDGSGFDVTRYLPQPTLDKYGMGHLSQNGNTGQGGVDDDRSYYGGFNSPQPGIAAPTIQGAANGYGGFSQGAGGGAPLGPVDYASQGQYAPQGQGYAPPQGQGYVPPQGKAVTQQSSPQQPRVV